MTERAAEPAENVQTEQPAQTTDDEYTLPPTSGFNTRAIHAGQAFEPITGAVVPPVHLSTTYAPETVGNLRHGYDYGRGTNPTRDSLQDQLAALEGGVDGSARAFTFGSGLAAENALIHAVAGPGAHIVMGNDVYGGTYRLINKILGPWGVAHTVVDMADVSAVEQALATTAASEVRILWLETPSNPMMKISDIAALAEAAHAAGALLVVDNTFATPYLQLPLELGADVVVHSTTKYIGGHSDVIGGAVVVNDPEIADQVQFQQFAAGAVNGPLDAYLTTRGLKTLGVRMDRHNASAATIAQHLQGVSGVERVLYPGLPDHPGHELASRQMRGYGGMVSVQFAGGAAAAKKVAETTRLFQLAESLGGVESLMNYPAEMTHASVAGTELAVPDNLVRLSVGIEDVADLIDDLDRAIGSL